MTKTTSVAKKALSFFLAALMLFSCMATANAADETPEWVKEAVEAAVVLKDADKAIVCAPTVSYLPEGVETATDCPVEYAIAPEEGVSQNTLQDGSTNFYNLTPGTEYTITGKVTVSETKSYTAEVIRTLKNGQAAPKTPVPSKVTSATIVVTGSTGAKYICTEKKTGKVITETTTTSFASLTPATTYVITAYFPETDDYYASEKVSVEVTTLKAAAAAPAVPVLKDKTNDSIVIAVRSGEEYSIDGGKTWKANGVFTGLKANTMYSVVARMTYDATKQDPSLVSAAFETFTNKTANYNAKLDNCAIEIDYEDKIYAAQSYTFAAIGDKPSAADAQYGDTRYVPVSFTYGGTAGEFAPEAATDKNPASKLGTFTATAENDNYKIVVTFELQEYNGEDWITVMNEDGTEKTENKEFTVDVSAEYNAIRAFFEFFINIFTHYLPLLIVRIGSSIGGAIG